MDFQFLENAINTGPGTAFDIATMSNETINKTVQFFASASSPTFAVTVELQVSLYREPTETQWLLARSFDLDENTPSDGQAMNGNWLLYRAYVRTISGTGATVSGLMKASK